MFRHVTPRRLRRAAAFAGSGLVLIPFLAASSSAAGGFAPGGVVVFRVGTGAAALTSAATATSLDEYTPAGGTPAVSIALPTTASGTATSEGEITLSGDGSHILATGYAAAAGTASVASGSSARVVDSVSALGTIDSSTALSSAYAGNNIRSAASPDGTSAIYSAGATTPGAAYSTDGSSTAVSISPGANYRQLQIFGGMLYDSSSSGTGPLGINLLGGPGLPTSGTTSTHLAGLDDGTSASPYGFLLLAEGGSTTPNVAYVADSTGGVEKYTLASGATSWTSAGSLTSVGTGITSSLTGVTGITGSYNATTGTTTLFATTPTTLDSIIDTSGAGTFTGTSSVLATAATNEAFRGVALAPSPLVATPPPSTPEVPLAVGLPLAGLVLAGGAWSLNRRRRT